MVMRPPFTSSEPVDVEPAAPKKTGARKAPAKSTARTRKVVTSSADPAPKPAKQAAKKTPAKAARTTTSKPPKPAASDSDAPAESKPTNDRPQRKPGPVEAATIKELTDLGVVHSALAAGAITMARNVDEADTAAGASAAMRELRMTLPLARTTVNPLSPSAGQKKPEDEDGEDGTVVGPNRLKALRERGAKRASS